MHKIDQALLDIFWSLAESGEDERVKSVVEMVRILKDKQSNSTDEVCPELKYVVSRLVRGLASDRKYARPSFSMALSQVLQAFTNVPIELVLDEAREKLKTTQQDSKSDETNALLGKLMVYLAVIQSGRILKETGPNISSMVADMYKLPSSKPFLGQITTLGLCQLIEKVSTKIFTKSILPSIQEGISKGWEDCTPNTLLLLMCIAKHHMKSVKEILSTKWGTSDLLASKHYSHIAQIMMASTSEHPVIHEVCKQLVTTALTTLTSIDNLKAFWNNIIDGKLASGNSTPNRVFLCYQLVEIALNAATKPEQIKVIMSKNILEKLLKDCSKKSSLLHSAALQLTNGLVAFVEKTDDKDLEVAVAKSLIMNQSSTVMFNGVTNTNTLDRIIQAFSPKASEEFTKLLQEIIGGKNIFGTGDLDAHRKWAIQQLPRVITSGDTKWQLGVLQYMLIHSSFIVKTTSDDIPMLSKLSLPLSAELRLNIKDALYKCLNKLATYKANKKDSHRDTRAYINLLYQLLNSVNSLFNDVKMAEPVKALNEEEKSSWTNLIEKVSEIHKGNHEASKMNKGHAFELLFLHLGLQLLSEPQSVIDILEDLYECHERALQKKKKSKKELQGEPEWIEVITEVLLSLLSQQSHFIRVMVTNVFHNLVPHLNEAAVNLLIKVLKSTGEEEEDDEMLGFDDDEDMDSVDESENDENEDEDEDEQEENESSSESEEESDSEADEAPDEAFREHLKAVLGPAAEKSDDEEEDDDLSDSEMFKLDDMLAAAFRSRVKDKKSDKEKLKQLVHFKMRCLELVEVIVTSEVSSAILIQLLCPLLDIMAAKDTKDRDHKEFAGKAKNVFHKLYKSKRVAKDSSSIKMELPAKMEELVEYSRKFSDVPIIVEVSNACLFLIRILLGIEHHIEPSPLKTRAQRSQLGEKISHGDQDNKQFIKILDIIKNALVRYFEKRDSHFNHMFFCNLFERQPMLMWPLATTLLEYGTGHDIRVFTKSQACSMLSGLISKKLVNEVDGASWKSFAGDMVTKIQQVILEIQEGAVKPKYVGELLQVVHKTITAKWYKYLQNVNMLFQVILEIQEGAVKPKYVKELLQVVHKTITADPDANLNFSDEVNEKLVSLKGSMGQDAIKLCRKLNIIKQGGNQTSKKNRKRIEEDSHNNGEPPEKKSNIQNGVHDTPQENLSPVKNEVTNGTTLGLTDTPKPTGDTSESKSSKKKKKRKSGAADTETILTETPNTTKAVSSKKKHKKKNINQE
ncbi:unnamed protein product [Owenia fusiformis]|uniref:Myb-binding protein 1A-like protein n=1 Tax=Owenia fusiformis TaxID=6347 RepID=A0A8S4Q4G9_OWEFU|nr:unnamed protein product [Owenia fusiformis]